MKPSKYRQRQSGRIAKAFGPPPEIEYTVTWTIQIYAPNAKEAATKALEIQRDPDSIATVFDVTLPSVITVDLG